MAEKKKYNSILISGRKDETLTYSKYVKDEESGESVKESLDKKVNVTDELTTQQIKDGAITNEKIAADSVGNINLQDGSVSNEKLEDGSITNEKLAENSITKDKLKDNTIGVEKLDPELRQTINAATGLPENLVETIQNVDDTLKDHQRQIDDKQSQIDDKQQQITANDEDISLLQTRSTQMEETIKSIAATGGASQATAVTYNNEKSKLTAVNIQSAVDEVVDKTAIKDEEGTVVETPFRYIQNEEFIFAKVDAEDKLLFGFQWDGTPVFGKTSAVEDRLQSQVNLLANKITTILGDDDTTSAIDTLKELKDFFANIDNTQTLTSILANLNSVSTKLGEDIKNLQDTKVDKEEGKSLIEDEVKECFRIIENEEFLKAIVDSDDKVLFGFYRATGKPYYPLNEMYHVIQNEEYFAAWVDAANHVLFGIRRDGEIIGEIHAVNALKQVVSQLQYDFASLQEKVGTIDSNLKELLDVFSLQENTEYLAVEQDAEGKVLSATNPDGSHYIHNAKSETIPEEFSHIEDLEGRTEITTDAEGKVLGYRDSEGTRHESSLDVDSLKVSNKDVENLIHDSINEIQLANINGIENHGKENLYTGYTQRYTTADGKQTFVSPNESLGGVFCNPIRCSAGEYFTRTGIATAIVVVSDKNDNNAQRVYRGNGSLPGNTFQIPTNWDWAYYLRCVCMSTDKELAIMRGKYAVKKSEQDGKLRIPDMKLSIANFTKETKYISSPNGTMYEIAVDNDGQLYAKEIDKDVIFPSDIPSNFKFTLVNNLTNGEKLPFDRFITNIDSYVGAWSANGLVVYKDLSPVTLNANWEYHKNSNGEGRYMCINGYNAQGFPKGFSVYDEDFKMIDNVEGNFDNHDYIYIDDGHYILFYESAHQVTIRGEKHTTNIPTLVEYKNGKILAQRLLNDEIIMNDLGPSNYYMSETHVNAIGFDGDNESRIIINPRHCMAFYILERNVSSDGSVSFGEVIAQVGGLHSLNNYNISSRIKTEEECQWFLCHDVKKWGEKSISGKSYPVYTLFDNNTYDNQGLNPNNTKNNKPSRIIQMAIDFENKEIVEYKIYQIDEYKSDIMSSAFMFDEGKFFIDYARQPICGYYDFTTGATTVSGNTYTGARKVMEFKSGTNTPYRVYPFNV